MRPNLKSALSMLLISSGAAATTALVAADGPNARRDSERPKIYDTTADGKAQVSAALKIAKAEDKRVMLKFGANW